MNKKGQEKYLSIWNFVMWIIITLALIIGISLFTDQTTDIRGIESQFLSEKIADCITENYNLKDSILDESSDLVEICNLAKNRFEPNSNFVAKIALIDLETKEEITSKFIGNPELYFQCDTKDLRTAQCITTKRYTNQDNPVLIEVTAGSING